MNKNPISNDLKVSLGRCVVGDRVRRADEEWQLIISTTALTLKTHKGWVYSKRTGALLRTPEAKNPAQGAVLVSFLPKGFIYNGS